MTTTGDSVRHGPAGNGWTCAAGCRTWPCAGWVAEPDGMDPGDRLSLAYDWARLAPEPYSSRIREVLERIRASGVTIPAPRDGNHLP